MTTDIETELTWDIDPLVDGRGSDGVEALLDEALTVATELAGSRGKIASFDASELAEFLEGYARVSDLGGRAGSYARLAFSADTLDPKKGALLQLVQERITEVSTHLLFFELEWAAVEDDAAERLIADPKLAFAAHYLDVLRASRPHLLTEPEERILAEKSVTSRAAWTRLFENVTSRIEVDLNGPTTLQEALSRLTSADREERRESAEAITKALEPGLETRAYIYNMLLQDKATEDRLRNYTHWLQSFNLSQEASDASVEALVGAVRKRYDLAQRWYRLKAGVLGIDKLAYYDRGAPVIDDDAQVSWDEAKATVLDCYTSFSQHAGEVTRRFFDERWIDVDARPGKVPGAFCAPTVASHHPYVLLNFTGKRTDVLTLAHELGHGLHQALGQKQGEFHHTTPLTVAETASVFGEAIVFNRLVENAESPESRFALLAQKVESSIATIFRQVAMNGFEARVHNARRSEGELPVDRFNELWTETQTEMLGDTVDLGDEYRSWWSYVPHFIAVPGYVYAYAFGNLLAISVYARYVQEGERFVGSYLEMLGAGGSKSPEELARMVDCDLTDVSFWEQGLALVERDITAAEEAAETAGLSRF
jgi:oligoendopeptidase F